MLTCRQAPWRTYGRTIAWVMDTCLFHSHAACRLSLQSLVFASGVFTLQANEHAGSTMENPFIPNVGCTGLSGTQGNQDNIAKHQCATP